MLTINYSRQFLGVFMVDKIELHEVKTNFTVRANAADEKSFVIWAAGGSAVPGHTKAIWNIGGFDGALRSMTASLQEAKPGTATPTISKVQFTLHNAAISEDGKTVRLIFEHDGDNPVEPYASIWLAANGVHVK